MRLYPTLLLLVLILGCDRTTPETHQPPAQGTPSAAVNPGTTARYVGSDACVSCHSRESALFSRSHHDLAMQPAGENTVLGDFNYATFNYNGITSTFYREGDQFSVRTDGADGSLQDFAIRYTFGVDPLQQYLIELPGRRLQALSIAWDSRPAAAGGQRWFHLYPDEAIDFKDPLHWTGPMQNWNSMCADCHSTALARNYDPEGQTWQTRWSEVDVSCEACHGPGSAHVELASTMDAGALAGIPLRGFTIDYHGALGGDWRFREKDPIARPEHPVDPDTLLAVCAPCHSRRIRLEEGPAPSAPSFLDRYLPMLLEEGLYFADGQMEGEVYEYGSFLQSRMYQAGVQCLDCHDPHSLKLLRNGNSLCTRCHLAAVFDATGHHLHPPGSEGAQCVACHMPPRTYMQVDVRHDHSFRIPRPDLSERLGLPDTCTGCHTDRTPAWAATILKERHGEPQGDLQYAAALHTARTRQPGAAFQLRAVVAVETLPAIVRGTALRHLGAYAYGQTLPVLLAGLAEADPLLRLGALHAITDLAPGDRYQLTAPLLRDPVKAVRIEAARLAAAVSGGLPKTDQQRLNGAVQEFLQVQTANAEHAWAQVNTGNLYRDLGDPGVAEGYYRKALVLEPEYLPATINLADLYRLQSREDQALSILRRAVAMHPESTLAQQALGMALVRQKEYPVAMEHFAKAAELDPTNTDIQLVHALALNSAGEGAAALAILETVYRRNPEHPGLLFTLATLYRDQGDRASARRYAQELVALVPEHRQARQLLEQMSQ